MAARERLRAQADVSLEDVRFRFYQLSTRAVIPVGTTMRSGKTGIAFRWALRGPLRAPYTGPIGFDAPRAWEGGGEGRESGGECIWKFCLTGFVRADVGGLLWTRPKDSDNFA